MRIVALIASPHGMGGNTGRLLDEVLAGVRLGGGNVDIVSLAETKVNPCLDCGACHRTGNCPIDDGFASIREKLLACDGFILASPNYIFSVPAQMKAVIDRCCGLVHGLMLEGKYAALVETSGSGDDDEVLAYMERVVNILGALSAGRIGSPMAGARTFPHEAELFAGARELGQELCACIREKRGFPLQEEFRHAFKNRIRRVVEAMKDVWPYEYNYWQRNGRP